MNVCLPGTSRDYTYIMDFKFSIIVLPIRFLYARIDLGLTKDKIDKGCHLTEFTSHRHIDNSIHLRIIGTCSIFLRFLGILQIMYYFAQ